MSISRQFVAAASLAACLAVPASADVEDRPFDFTDAFYLAHGINPAGILGRPQPNGTTVVSDPNTPGPQYRPVRLLGHAACWDHSGHPTYFTVNGVLNVNSFTNDAAGQEALETAESFDIYEFPRAANPQFSVFPKNQDAVVDLSGGYFSNDPLGIWKVNIVRYTPAAFNTAQGQQRLAQLAAENGHTLDGTPIIKTLSDINNLKQEGLVTVQVPPIGGPDLRWFMCPVPHDLTDGTIAPDASVAVVSKDGLPLAGEAEFVRNFHCLQDTGDFCDSDCLSDVNVNRQVNIDDLFLVINAWGSCPLDCLQDINGDHSIDIDDLFAVINAWGACQ